MTDEPRFYAPQVRISPELESAIKTEADIQMRSFTQQVNLILTLWVSKQKIRQQKKEEVAT